MRRAYRMLRDSANPVQRPRAAHPTHSKGCVPRQGWPRWTRSAALCGLLALLLPAGCELGRHREPPRQVPGGVPSRGRVMLQEYACGACHTIPGVPRADGRVAPPLSFYASRSFVAGMLPNSPEELIRWIMNPQNVNPQTAMPDLGVREQDARDIAAYLYTLR
jgi:cytochrome c